MNIRPIPTLTERDLARFQSKIKVHPVSGCHEWQGALTDGYGDFWIQGSTYRAHRVAYVLAHGEPAPGLVIDHACRNRRCLNAADGHLRAITNAENIRIGMARQHNATKIVCPRGHALASYNLIPSLMWAGRACRSCDIAARSARHKGLTGTEREVFIKQRGDEKYQLLQARHKQAAAA